MKEIQKKLFDYLPPVFLGTEIDKLLGNAIRWRTIQNIRSSRDTPKHKKIPKDCFLKYGRKVLIVRDPFIEL